MDNFDYKILECLKSDARMSYQRVSEKVGLSISSVGRRIHSMETKNVIVDRDKKNNVKDSYFTVNLGVLLTPKSNKFRDAPDLWIMNNENNTFSYMSKKFNSMNEATEHMNNLISAGYRDLSVVKID